MHYARGEHMPFIEIKGVSYVYPLREGVSLKAVKNLSLSIEAGEFVALTGMNGSGKSTLAKLLNGLFKPTEGEILIDGVSTANEERIFDIRRRVGMVFQNPDNQTVATLIEDDVAFGPENLGLPRDEIIKRVNFALQAVGMSEYRKRDAAKLSGGQKQRVAIAGVLAMRPDVLILDEATSMLDPAGREEVMGVVRKLVEQGITVINITHNMEEAALAKRVVVLRKGRLAIDGTPSQVFSSSLFESCGLTLPPAAALAKELKDSGIDVGTVTTEESFAEGICKLLR